jgi:hypothetical protein
MYLSISFWSHTYVQSTRKKMMASTVSRIRTSDLPIPERETLGKASEFRECRGSGVLTTAPPRLFCLLSGIGRRSYIKVDVKSGALREVRSREGVLVDGLLGHSVHKFNTTNTNPKLGVVDDLYRCELKYSASNGGPIWSRLGNKHKQRRPIQHEFKCRI